MAATLDVPAPGPAMSNSQSLGLTATMKNGGKSGSECVKVVVRVRPLSDKEVSEGREKCVQMDLKRNVAVLKKPGGTERDSKDFTFDAVFDETLSQQQIFDDTALEIVDSVMDGFNGTIFAYGQTGAGKSFTMTGPEHGPMELKGLLPRSFRHIFSNIDTTSHNVKYLVRGSFLEIYNEEIRDLLSKNPKDRCELKDSPNSGVYVKDLSAFVVKSVEEMNQVLTAGLSNRSVGSTNMNEESSRSHSIFMITVEQCALDKEGEGHIRVGKLNMVDLAGSERQSKTGATGERLKEATKINLSLSALGNVISALVDGKSSHIPYRDSKLTRLLQDSLGGNTKTVMVANCGPADYNYDETLSTLRYAYRAKSIKNKPRINEDPKDAMIREFQDEIMRLKAELDGRGGGLEGGEAAVHTAPTPLPPRIQKEVVYVEKIVEKPVEKEVIIEQGARPEEIAEMEANLRTRNEELRREADAKRADVAAKRQLAESEKQRLLAEIDREEKDAMAEQARKAELEGKLAAMEHKMLAGKQVMEKAIEQEKELKSQQKELRRQKKIEEKLKEREEQQRLENLELETKCASQEEQVQKMTSKLQKLWDKYQKAQQEIVDIQQFNQGEREDMLSMIRDLRQTLKLKTLIMESFVPVKEIQSTHERAYWDAEEDEWRIRPMKIDKTNRPVRPGSALGLPRPTSEFARINLAMGDTNPRYMYDSIAVTDLDLPERTTEDYDVNPELGDRIERALLLALSPDDDGGLEDGEDRRSDARPGTGTGTSQRRRPSSGRPMTGKRHDAECAREAAFPQARGLVSRE
mmetsp:Transcript_27419/g.59937  ORF Transcript_27419/g.59937 Transcript_27419/m.59937 type:complete len:805 (-) Transcript_27419:181-2595(-)|eukprot:CAMPEP_0170599334 /NCGR_PEP_ID=MMETSP0224-20130122/16738_1 /TAXON_ID=285029 /ORGANISM="Togula jolla, Strain CCCM 725" /LENGTH=804 /DNA_ID=CAMNT_0010923971 /DNA_START=14 /DNA_END=2428 /DNA_ORIENTATION=+